MNGKVNSGDNLSICSNMFPDGAPTDASDVLEMTFRQISGGTTTDTTMTKISRSEYKDDKSLKHLFSNSCMVKV